MFDPAKIILVLESLMKESPVIHIHGHEITNLFHLNIEELCTVPENFNPDKFMQMCLKDKFDYDEKEGKLTYREDGQRVKIGQVAGTKQKGGATYIYFKGKQYPAASLIWLYLNGDLPAKIPWHKNANFSDDRMDNLCLKEEFILD